MYIFKPFRFEIVEPFPTTKRPRARSGHRIVCDDKYMYSIGGFNPCVPEHDAEMSEDEVWKTSRPLFKELWRFNLSTKKWQRYPGQIYLPIELASTAVLLFRHKLIFYGGTAVPFGESCSNKLYVCDLEGLDGSVCQLPAVGSLPDPQYGQALVKTKNFIYTVGGTTGYEYTCDVHRYDLRVGVWESVYICSGRDPMEPPGRYRHELAFDGRRIYVLGGGTGVQSFGFSHIPAFDIETNTWSILHAHADPGSQLTFPGARRCHGAVQYLDKETQSVHVIISGGFCGGLAYKDVWRLNLKNLQWNKIVHCTLPKPLYFHSAAVTPAGKMYTFGGIIETHEQTTPRTSDVLSTWVIIPSLSEICWEAVNHYYELRAKSRDQLLDIGIPLKFINRLFD
ncbi:kelch domain-containing protein 10 homolog [Fopius arisanus]|uniref:Kelch domain-containing protein 10 homolog n=1 Tax=Fopius arisanus TaxID=64838 RepID=A0A0C9QXL6_9HYME|nr:PREDICTED: kelch domain-containing protein 10 homolog [Fopius arisanus]